MWATTRGGVAERRGSGLQSRPHGFESRRHLSHPPGSLPCRERAIGAAVARFPDTEEVTGSIPVSPTIKPPDQDPGVFCLRQAATSSNQGSSRGSTVTRDRITCDRAGSIPVRPANRASGLRSGGFLLGQVQLLAAEGSIGDRRWSAIASPAIGVVRFRYRDMRTRAWRCASRCCRRYISMS